MSTPRLRPALDAIPAYTPGRPPSATGRPTYKLSSNENPYPPLPGVLAAAARAAAKMNRYPDMGVTRLYDALAGHHGIDTGRLAAGSGSVAVLYHLLQACCQDGDEVVYAWRSFEAYPIAVGLTGAHSVQVPLDGDARHDLPAMLAAITDATKVVIVCSPNNPTGPAVHRDELEAFIDGVPSHVVVALDEAYREFVSDPGAVDGLELTHGRANLVLLRTFSKAYGLAGLRVGYAVGTPDMAQAMRKCAIPFGVSQVAEEAAIASLGAEPQLFVRVAGLVTERARVLRALRAQGWDVPDSQGNFVWLALGAGTLDFAAACDDAGVSVRPFAGEGARVSVGETEANDVLIAVADSWRSARR